MRLSAVATARRLESPHSRPLPSLPVPQTFLGQVAQLSDCLFFESARGVMPSSEEQSGAAGSSPSTNALAYQTLALILRSAEGPTSRITTSM